MSTSKEVTASWDLSSLHGNDKIDPRGLPTIMGHYFHRPSVRSHFSKSRKTKQIQNLSRTMINAQDQ